jgi:hypothetical protein
MMPATVPSRSMTGGSEVMRRLSNRNNRRIPQIRREHQDQRRDGPERKKRV